MFSPFLSDCLVSEEWSWTQRMALTGGEGDELIREWIDHFPSNWQTYRISFQVLHGGFRNVGFPSGSDSKESACNAGDPGLIPGLGRSCGEGNGNPLWYSCLENPMDRRAWQGCSLRGYKESDTTEQLTVFSNKVSAWSSTSSLFP